MQSTFARLATAAMLAYGAGTALAQTITPPPLPPGSRLVRPEAGLNEAERKRYVRAHHHKMHNRKDYTRDDSVAGAQPAGGAAAVRPVGMQAAPVPGTAPGVTAPAAGRSAAPGGAGTGPAREKTDRGASSYFYGNNKK